MTILVWLFAAAAFLEIAMHGLPFAWPARKVLASIILPLTGFSLAGLLTLRPNMWSALLFLLGLYRLLNNLRVVKERMHLVYLRRATWRTSWHLLVLQAAVGILWVSWDRWHFTGHSVWVAVAITQFVVAALLLASTIRNLRKTRWPQAAAAHLDPARLPTLTVAIPARNETDDLEVCLRSLTASDYPKLEIIVLDDCSQLRRTPEIIREFAHDGVRFVQGEEPRETWLPKNQAYQRLLDEASGKLVLFCGVDARFAPGTLRQIVGLLLAKNKQMMSILPAPTPAASAGFALIQAMRYWWELVPPRRFLRRPPVLSSCWIADKAALLKAGGFAAVSRSIVPEAYFAKRLIQTEKYSFMRAGATMGLTSDKTAPERRATAIRTRYPQLHRRPENVAVGAAAELFCLVLPFVLAVFGSWLGLPSVAQVLSMAAALLLTIGYELMALATHTNSWWFGLVALPVMVLTDMALLHISMWQYEFSTVEWKNRNICVPVMHVVPHLPRLE